MAVAKGCYDAADFLTQRIQEIEKRTQPSARRASVAGLNVLGKASWKGVTVTSTRRVGDESELLFIDRQAGVNKVGIGWNGKLVWGELAPVEAEKKGERTLMDGDPFTVSVLMYLEGEHEHRYIEIIGETRHGLLVYLDGEMVYSEPAVNELEPAHGPSL